MTIPYRVETLEAAPEAARSLYQEAPDGGGYVLPVEGVADAAELDRFKAKALKAEAEAIERRKALKAWEEFGTPDEVRQRMEAAAKGADQEKIVAELRKKGEAEVAQWRDRFTGLQRQVYTEQAKAALAKAGVLPEGLDLLATVAAQRMRLHDDGLTILSADGTSPMVGRGANGGATVDDLAAELAKAYPMLVRADGAGGGGKPQNGAGGKPGAKQISRAEFDRLDHFGRAEFAKSGGKVVD